MIQVPTVLLLGAGASASYGFPLGSELRDRITQINPEKYASVLEAQGIGVTEFLAFQDTFQHSAYTSIDWFLEDYPKYMMPGKAAIALALIPLEIHDRLFPPHAGSEHWYEIFYNAMCDEKGVLVPENIAVLTLNYDRSLEQYLSTVLRKRLGDADAVARTLGRIPIIHLHGLLGNLTAALDGSGRPYINQIEALTFGAAMHGIVVVSEADSHTDGYRQAAEYLRSAERIVFLGFGYHEATLRRLGVFNESWPDDRRTRTVVTGTSRWLPAPTWERVHRNVLEAFWTGNRQIGTVTFMLTEILELDSPSGTRPR